MEGRGLEVFSPRDGGWYDITLSHTRVIEWKDRLALRIRLRGFESFDDELLEYHEAMSDDYFRFSARAIDDEDVNDLVPFTRIAGLAKSKTTNDSRWFDAIVLKVHRTTTKKENWTLVTVKWLVREEASGFGQPKTNTLAVEQGEVCSLSPIPASKHPSLIRWRKMLEEVHTTKKKHSGCKKKAPGARGKGGGERPEAVSTGERLLAPLLLNYVPRADDVSVLNGRVSVEKLVGRGSGAAANKDDSVGEDGREAAADGKARAGEPSGSGGYAPIEGMKKLKKRQSVPTSDGATPQVAKKICGKNRGRLDDSPAGGTPITSRGPELRSQVFSAGDPGLGGLPAFECGRNSADRDLGGEVVVGQSVLIQEVPNIVEESLDEMDECRVGAPCTAATVGGNGESQGTRDHQRKANRRKGASVPAEQLTRDQQAEAKRREGGSVPEEQLNIEKFPVRKDGGGEDGSRDGGKKKPRLSSRGEGGSREGGNKKPRLTSRGEGGSTEGGNKKPGLSSRGKGGSTEGGNKTPRLSSRGESGSTEGGNKKPGLSGRGESGSTEGGNKKPRLSSRADSGAAAQAVPEPSASEMTGPTRPGSNPSNSDQDSMTRADWGRGLNIPSVAGWPEGTGLDPDGGHESDSDPTSEDFIPVPRFEEDAMDVEGDGADSDPEVVVVKEMLAGDREARCEGDADGMDDDQAMEYSITARRCPKVTLDVVGSGRGFVCARDLRFKWRKSRCDVLLPAKTPFRQKQRDDESPPASERMDQSPSLDDWNQSQGRDCTPPTPCSKSTDLDLSFAPSTERDVYFPSSFVFGKGTKGARIDSPGSVQARPPPPSQKGRV